MSTFVKTRIIKIGNSHGLRIPKLLIDQIGLKGEVEIEAQTDQLVIRPVRSPRQGWEAQFEEMAKRGDDRMLDEAIRTRWEETEWEW